MVELKQEARITHKLDHSLKEVRAVRGGDHRAYLSLFFFSQVLSFQIILCWAEHYLDMETLNREIKIN